MLIFSLTYEPFIGGAEVAIREITDRISKDDIEFHMVTLRFDASLPRVEQVGNVLVHRIGFSKKNPSASDLKRFPLHLNKLIFQFSSVLKAFQLHNHYHYDALWAMMAHSCAVPAGLFKLRYPNTPYILTLQEGDPLKHIERTMLPLWPLFKRGFSSANYLQAISHFLAKWGVDRGFTGTPEVIPNGVAIERFSKEYTQDDIETLTKELGKKKDDAYVITASRLVPKNGIDDVIKSLSLLPPHIHFLILGTGPEEEALAQLAHTEGVSARVHFLGHISHEKLPLYFKVSDIFIRPSRSEGMGNAFIEAFASGIPVIATQVGGIADFLFDTERNPGVPATGFVVDVESPEQIAQKVLYILDNKSAVAEVVARAQAVSREYDWDLIARDMKIKVFDRALQ